MLFPDSVLHVIALVFLTMMVIGPEDHTAAGENVMAVTVAVIVVGSGRLSHAPNTHLITSTDTLQV